MTRRLTLPELRSWSAPFELSRRRLCDESLLLLLAKPLEVLARFREIRLKAECDQLVFFRFGPTVQLPEYERQLVMRVGRIRQQSHGLLEMRQGVGGAINSHEHEGEVVMRTRHVGLCAQRRFIVRNGVREFFQMRQHVSQVIVRLR